MNGLQRWPRRQSKLFAPWAIKGTQCGSRKLPLCGSKGIAPAATHHIFSQTGEVNCVLICIQGFLMGFTRQRRWKSGPKALCIISLSNTRLLDSSFFDPFPFFPSGKGHPSPELSQLILSTYFSIPHQVLVLSHRVHASVYLKMLNLFTCTCFKYLI